VVSRARQDVVVYDEYGPVRMIRTHEWKYVQRHPAGPNELYNLRQDPNEWNNLAGNPEWESVKKELGGYMPATNAEPLKEKKY